MNKLMLFIAIAAIVSCNAGETKTPAADSVNNPKYAAVSYPYPINYSSQFENGDPQKSKLILDLWKDFDNNTLDNAKSSFADTVTLVFPGMEMHGSRDSIISSTKAYRNSYNAVSSSVDAVISTKSIDKNENWVLVWGTEVHTTKKNIVDSIHLQEAWLFNNDGKIVYMMQYARQPVAPITKSK